MTGSHQLFNIFALPLQMRSLTPMAEKGAFVCQPVTSASDRRLLREGFAKLFCEASASAEVVNGGLTLTDGVKR